MTPQGQSAPTAGPVPAGWRAWLLAGAVLAVHLVLLTRGWTTEPKNRLGHAGPAPSLQVRLLVPAPPVQDPADQPPAPSGTMGAPRRHVAAPKVAAERSAGSPDLPRRPDLAESSPGPTAVVVQEAGPALTESEAASEAADERTQAEPGAAAAGDAPPPVYVTSLPQPARLAYQGHYLGRPATAVLDWQHADQRYQLQFDATGPDRVAIRQLSHGQIDAAGLAPERHIDRRAGRSARAANIDRAAGQVRFSSSAALKPAWPGTQDRLAWVLQLVAIVRAAAERGQALPMVLLHVVDVRGGAALLHFKPQGMETLALPWGLQAAQHWMHEPAQPDGLRIEAWLAPALGHWPVRLRQTLLRSGATIDWQLVAPP